MIDAKRIALAFMFAATFASTKANATAVIECTASDGRSGAITINVGRLPVLGVLRADITAFGKTWSTREDAENPVVVGQGVQNRDGLQIDFTDPNIESIFISLRTVSISTKKETGEAGVLRIGEAVYPVICTDG